eukprot:SAG31_NODE_6286_length_2084_cov_1.593451_3_plen_90_part_01
MGGDYWRSLTIPIDACARTVVAEVILECIFLAEGLKVAARLLAVQTNLMYVIVADQIVVWKSGACGDDADTRADADDSAVTTLHKLVPSN